MKKLKVLTIVDTRPKITRLSRVMAVPDASETIEALHHGHNCTPAVTNTFWRETVSALPKLKKPFKPFITYGTKNHSA